MCMCVCVCGGGGGGGDSVCGEEGLKGVVVPCREGSEAGHARVGGAFLIKCKVHLQYCL